MYRLWFMYMFRMQDRVCKARPTADPRTSPSARLRSSLPVKGDCTAAAQQYCGSLPFLFQQSLPLHYPL